MGEECMTEVSGSKYFMVHPGYGQFIHAESRHGVWNFSGSVNYQGPSTLWF